MEIWRSGACSHSCLRVCCGWRFLHVCCSGIFRLACFGKRFTPRCGPASQVKPSWRDTPVSAVRKQRGCWQLGSLRDTALPAETRPCPVLPWAYFTPHLSRSPPVEAIHPKRRTKSETGGMLPGGARRGQPPGGAREAGAGRS